MTFTTVKKVHLKQLSLIIQDAVLHLSQIQGGHYDNYYSQEFIIKKGLYY